MERFRQYWTSRSGYVRPREAVGLGGVVVLLVCLAVVFGMVGQANADVCYGLAEGECGWVFTYDHNCPTAGAPYCWKYYYCHYSDQNGGCTFKQAGCWSC